MDPVACSNLSGPEQSDGNLKLFSVLGAKLKEQKRKFTREVKVDSSIPFLPSTELYIFVNIQTIEDHASPSNCLMNIHRTWTTVLAKPHTKLC